MSGLIPLLGLAASPCDPLPLIYSFFVLATLGRRPLERAVSRLPGPVVLHLFGFVLLAGLGLELLAWVSNYLAQEKEPALLHPQLIPDLILAFGFYGGIALAWVIVVRWFQFSPGAAFLVTGLMGVGFEQMGSVLVAIATALLASPLPALFMALYVLIVYGSIAGIALTPLATHLNTPTKSLSWWRFPLVFLLMMILAAVGTMVMELSATALGGLPAKRPMHDHPFW